MCAKKAAREDGAPANKKPCHCEQACSAREITQPVIAVPAVAQTDLPTVTWIWQDALPRFERCVVAIEEFAVHETGPPRPSGALYLRHCALLN